ncbi:MAG: replication-associated recombination protein A [Firmicutes bacterium]|nr:replication-associated recombination protein A [Bacillota bacterium]
MDLFAMSNAAQKEAHAPLAWRMRPQELDEVAGQSHIIGPGAPLRNAIEKDQLHSLVLYGPPGTGKTSIARIIARMTNSHFEYMQAVTAGVSDIRKAASDAQDRLKYYQQKTILFVDEIHRFNKSQQDVLLPFVEDGTLILVGATTENPLYELNTALLSRMKLYILEALSFQDIAQIIDNALQDKVRGLGNLDITLSEESLAILIQAAQGDARMALNILDTIHNSYLIPHEPLEVTAELIKRVTGKLILKYDRSGNYHYDTISAFIKSIRGSDPNATLYWMAVMLEGGEDPKYIARRLIVHAAEDIGLADPHALSIAMAAASAVDYVGLPEARIPLAEAAIYLATAPKSNSTKVAIDAALTAVRTRNRVEVPAHLGDTSHSQAGSKLGKGKDYKYPHDFGGYVPQDYLPAELGEVSFYHPSTNGYESTIMEFLLKLPNPTKK